LIKVLTDLGLMALDHLRIIRKLLVSILVIWVDKALYLGKEKDQVALKGELLLLPTFLVFLDLIKRKIKM